MSKLQIVPFTVAQDLKTLGFDWECYHSSCSKYPEDIHLAFDLIGENKFTVEDILRAKKDGEDCVLVPEQALVIKYFRDVHNIHINITNEFQYKETPYYVTVTVMQPVIKTIFGELYETYEDAEIEGIKAAIKYLKEKKNDKA